MKRIAPLLFALAVTLSALAVETNAADPAAVTDAAYRTALKHFGFTLSSLAYQKPYLTPALYAALLKKVSQPVPKGDAPTIEGDLLLNCQDPPDHVEVGPALATGHRTQIHVTLSWPTEKRDYLVSLVLLSSAWKITDINFGKDGNLSDLIK